MGPRAVCAVLTCTAREKGLATASAEVRLEVGPCCVGLHVHSLGESSYRKLSLQYRRMKAQCKGAQMAQLPKCVTPFQDGFKRQGTHAQQVHACQKQ